MSVLDNDDDTVGSWWAAGTLSGAARTEKVEKSIPRARCSAESVCEMRLRLEKGRYYWRNHLLAQISSLHASHSMKGVPGKSNQGDGIMQAAGVIQRIEF